jgi:hypothetical protein
MTRRIVFAPAPDKAPGQATFLTMARASREARRASREQLDAYEAGRPLPAKEPWNEAMAAGYRVWRDGMDATVAQQLRRAASLGAPVPRRGWPRISAANLRVHVEEAMVREITTTTIAVEMVAAVLRDRGRDVSATYPDCWPGTAVVNTIAALERGALPSEWVECALDRATGFLRVA